MTQWVWQQQNWPRFTYQTNALQELEKLFLQNAGYLLGVYQHISASEQDQIIIDLVSEEAVETSAIEGEFLDRSSVQASLRCNFGLIKDDKGSAPSERGIAYMMVDLYKNFAAPLTTEVLCDWHLHLMGARPDLNSIGTYRRHADPMQIVSGTGNNLKIHYEAPPSQLVAAEMSSYIQWFNSSVTIPALTRAGIAHLYFEMIHPFEDGNGRIGRAIAEKSISQSLKQPLLLAISKTIQKNKKQYYAALAAANTSLDITAWLVYFSEMLLEAQQYTRNYLEFVIEKAKLYDRVKDQLNARQAKVVARMFKEGVQGFMGGLSAEKYLTITQTSRATATRDLQDLVQKQVLYSSGERKSTRYFLNIATFK
jgi:Fic family protein